MDHAQSTKICGNCLRVKFNLTSEELAFITRMYDSFNRETIEQSWLRDGKVHRPAWRGIDENKVRFIELSRKRWCWKEKTLVAATDLACYAWKQKEVAP